MNLLSLIPTGLALYYVYKSKDDLQNQFNRLQDSTQAQLDVQREQVEQAINPSSAITRNLKITPKTYFRSIADQYWTSATWVTIKNDSQYVVQLRGIRLTMSLGGAICNFMPYYVGNYWIQPNQSVTIRLSGAYTKKMYEQKAERNNARKHLEQNPEGSVMKCTAEIVLTVQGTTNLFRDVQENITGEAYLNQELPDGAKYRSGEKSGAGIEVFDGGEAK